MLLKYNNTIVQGMDINMINTTESSFNDRNDILIKVRFVRPSLTKSEKKVADFLLENPKSVLESTLAEYAQSSGASQATILRFCRRLGVDGFPEMKLQLSAGLSAHDTVALNQKINSEDTLQEIMEKVFWFNIQTLKDTLSLVSYDCEKALDFLLAAESITFFAIGDAGAPCYFADIKFKRLGLRSQMNTDPDIQLIMANSLGPGDVAIAVSHSGRSRSVVEAMRVAKQRGAATICITKYDKSPLVKHCDVKLYTSTTDATVGKEIIARRIAEQAILESLYLGVLARRSPELFDKLKGISKILEFNKM